MKEKPDPNEEMREAILDGKVSRSDVTVDKGTTRPIAEGYFGNFTIITVGGKKTLVFGDPRDSICVPMIDDWYDDVRFTDYGWSPDTRFVSDPNSNPLLVKRNGKWTMIGYYGQKVRRGDNWLRVPYCDEWYDSIGKTSRVAKGVRFYEASRNGEAVRLTPKCQVIEEDASDVIATVKKWDKDRIVRDWIDKGMPCYHISGFRYRGAKARKITNDEARDLIKVYHFGKGFSSIDWNIEDGHAALVFKSYSEADME